MPRLLSSIVAFLEAAPIKFNHLIASLGCYATFSGFYATAMSSN
jgi:hypothetical protein